MSRICENIEQIKQELPESTRLVAVSKFHSEDAITQAYLCGQRVFGENKVQELTRKQSALPKDIEWHFIGHLQSNKVKTIVPFISLIHSIDSYKLLEEVHKSAVKVERTINCLLQIHIAQEDTKFGFSYDECLNLLDNSAWKSLNGIRISGLMGMASLTDNEQQIKKEFTGLKIFFDRIKLDYFKADASFKELSIGMSDDYRLAVESGSTLVRIGSTIFGERIY